MMMRWLSLFTCVPSPTFYFSLSVCNIAKSFQHTLNFPLHSSVWAIVQAEFLSGIGSRWQANTRWLCTITKYEESVARERRKWWERIKVYPAADYSHRNQFVTIGMAEDAKWEELTKRSIQYYFSRCIWKQYNRWNLLQWKLVYSSYSIAIAVFSSFFSHSFKHHSELWMPLPDNEVIKPEHSRQLIQFYPFW